jgi:hypothetical protein
MLKAKPADVQDKIERLRRQRLADEAARKSAGTWGDRMVGELQHAASGTVYVQVWKGSRRPDLLLGAATRAPQVPSTDMAALTAWLKAKDEAGFTRRMIACDLSAAEAQRVKDARIAANRAAGVVVINPPLADVA